MARFKIASPLDSYRVGDKPGTITVELATPTGQPVGLDGITSAAAVLVSPAGVEHELGAAITGDEISVAGGELELDEPGLWELELTVTGATSTIAIEPAASVVEAKRDGWHTLASARGQWSDAPRLDVSLYTFLEGAKGQIIEYGPELVAGARAPLGWQQAQLMQARNCWNAAKSDPASGGIGGDDLVFRPYPMDQTIRLIIRPKRAIGATA